MVTQTFLQDLEMGDEETRRQIIYRQPIPPDPKIVPALIDCLSDPSAAVCEAAVDALGNCIDPYSIGLIIPRLYSPNPAERNYVLEIIGKIRNPALAPVMMLLDNPDRNIRKQAVEALVMVASAMTFPPLRRALNDPDQVVATSAAEALGLLRFNQAVPCLAEALGTENKWMKIAVLTSLANIGGLDALQIICNMPIDQPEIVTAAVIRAVGSTADADNKLAIHFLTTLLKKASPAIEEKIMCTLEPLLEKNNPLSQDQQQTIIHLARKFLGSSNPVLCANAIKCLSMVVHFQPGELSGFAQSRHFLVRSAALQAMLLTTDIDMQLAASMAIDSCEKDELRIQALRVLANTTEWNPWMETQLFAITQQDEFRVRIAAINTLLEWESEKGITAIMDLFDDKDNWDEEIFVSEFKINSAGLFLKIIEIGFKKLDDSARYRLFHGLCPFEKKYPLLLNPTAEYNILLSALQDRFWAIRVHAARLYGERFTENEYVLVLMATQDSDERVRVTAINILNDMNKLNQDLFILLLHDNNPRVHRSVLMIMLGMDVDQIPPSVKTEAYKIFTSTAENEKKDFTKLYQEIIKKILPTTAVKGASPNERN